jgi:hypothetical protein
MSIVIAGCRFQDRAMAYVDRSSPNELTTAPGVNSAFDDRFVHRHAAMTIKNDQCFGEKAAVEDK